MRTRRTLMDPPRPETSDFLFFDYSMSTPMNSTGIVVVKL